MATSQAMSSCLPSSRCSARSSQYPGSTSSHRTCSGQRNLGNSATGTQTSAATLF